MQETYDILETIFEDVFDDEIKLTPEMTAHDVPGWDSLSHIRLMLTVERKFKTKFSNTEIGELKSVGDLVTLIEKHAAK